MSKTMDLKTKKQVMAGNSKYWYASNRPCSNKCIKRIAKNAPAYAERYIVKD